MAIANIDLVAGRKKKKRNTRNKVGQGSEKHDEAEECNMYRAANWQMRRKATENQ
jgi:hypothetical protein